MIVILGENSRLTKVLSGHYKNQVLILNRGQYSSWQNKDKVVEIHRFFSRNISYLSENIIYITASILDPRISLHEHLKINFNLVQNIFEGTKDLNFRMVTFGTVLENLIPAENQNNYVHSKYLLSQYIHDLSIKHYPMHHFRLHTLYGVDRPSSFMFLGQVLSALINKTPFKMSSGLQLREYHHFEDVMKAILLFLRQNTVGIVDVSHGETFTLNDIAKSIFNYFQCTDLLKIGDLTDPIFDNYVQYFKKNPIIENVSFRPSLNGINHYLDERLKEVTYFEQV